MIDIATLFDLERTHSGRLVVRANYTEVMNARSAYYAMRHSLARYGKRAEVSHVAMDTWLTMCNEIIDLHHIRKPLTRGAT